jgi:2-polyprenyl-6-methoxyphenol hydroxylase-like FAD-dependent oxidoreductase
MQEASAPVSEKFQVRCLIAGGGPAGMMLGFLLARAGIQTLVLEKHADFLRDFRGDTVHPSTLEIIYELGLLDEFLERPHQKVTQVGGQVGSQSVVLGDFTHLRAHSRFMALMPQWEFLDFLATHARTYPAFGLRMQAEVTGLIEEGARIAGVVARTPQGLVEIRAELVVGADGRHSVVRDRAGLPVEDLGAPMDVLWMRLSKRSDDPAQVFGRVDAGRIFVMFDRGDYWQCAYVIPKGGIEEVRRSGLPALRASVCAIAPFLADRVDQLADWDAIKLLTVAVDRLRTWHRPGLLCIGDAAHAMSPIGGVGINLAIQDAVATANILAPYFLAGPVNDKALAQVQRRRLLPTRLTQRLQVFVQNRVISRVLGSSGAIKVAWPVRLLNAWPFLRRIPARVLGMGFRPEHVRTPDVRRMAQAER